MGSGYSDRDSDMTRARRVRKKKKKKEMSKVLVPMLLIFLLIFTIIMVIGFFVKGTEPSTLIMSVYGACTGELLALAKIKTTKVKHEEGECDDGRFIA